MIDFPEVVTIGGTPFELSGGTIIGRRHRKSHTNRQDYHIWSLHPTLPFVVGIVTDGVSHGDHELGALAATRILRKTLLEKLGEHQKDLLQRGHTNRIVDILNMSLESTLSVLEILGRSLEDDLRTAVEKYLLFTLAGFVMTPDYSWFFGIGDPVFAVNGEITSMPGFEDNAPACPMHRRVRTRYTPEDLAIHVVAEVPTPDLQSWMLGSDGVNELIEAEGKNYPGQEKTVGSISDLWCDDKIFNNPGEYLRTLGLDQYLTELRDHPITHKPKVRLLEYPGLFGDDLTVVIGRRQQGDGPAAETG